MLLLLRTLKLENGYVKHFLLPSFQQYKCATQQSSIETQQPGSQKDLQLAVHEFIYGAFETRFGIACAQYIELVVFVFVNTYN